MHLHVYLKETIENLSSPYGFWLFSFERYNGYIKDIDTNQKDAFETTFMRKFQQKTGARDFVRSFELFFGATSWCMNFLYRFVEHIQPIETMAAVTQSFDVLQFYALSISNFDVYGSEPLLPNTNPLKVCEELYMLDAHYNCLLEFYRIQYENRGLEDYRQATREGVFVGNRIEKIKTITLMGQTYRSLAARSHRGAHVLVKFVDSRRMLFWPGEIQYFFRHQLQVNGVFVPHVMAFVRWFGKPPQTADMHLHTDGFVETWLREYDDYSYECIVPVHRLYTQVAVVKGETTVTVIPLHKKILA